MLDGGTSVIDRPTDRTGGRNIFGWKVVLFNCNCHTFEAVIAALQASIRCSPEKGYNIAMSIHNNGKAIVYSGVKERCEAVTEILKDAGLRVNMEQ